MSHTKKNRMMISATGLAIIAATAAACTSSPSASSSPPGKGGPTASTDAAQVPSLLQTGIAQTSQQNWSAATTTFDNVLAIDPTNVYANYDLGVIAQTNGNSAGAISYYNKALAANTAYTPAMYNEAILLESTQPAQAIAVYQKVVSIDPKASTAYLRMALVQAEQGDTTDAKANDAKAVKIDSALSQYKLPAKK
ncbi:MAG TPA: tetratricopeptide repeat protein [Trebonia sp.]|jgi:Tfp pilus assembly protein PilF|nr:tetratricopeptide repeat protein [Trebonia sp.]